MSTPPPPRNAGFITFTVDGKEVVARPGTNMIDAAQTVGVEIPYYCYHKRLSIAANCRMCLVETNTAPKLVPACQTAIAEGMVVNASSDKVQAQRKAVMEFLLLSHPVDCSICDQAGECKLQDYYMRYDFKPSRLSGQKILRNKRKALNESIVLDQERCVMCTRCVRFMEEVVKKPQLGVFGRGSHEVVDISPAYGKLESNYSANIVDLCPVGALLNRDFRFRARSWFLSSSPSICTGCSRGCNVNVDFMGQDTFRYRPRENEQVNQSWICDQGRLTYKALNRHRVAASALGRGNDSRDVPNAEAIAFAAEKLKGLTGALAIAVSPHGTNEDLLAGLTFVRDVLGMKVAYVTGHANGEGDDFLITADKNPNRKGLEWIAKGLGVALKPFDALVEGIESGEVKALFALGDEVPESPEAFSGRLDRLDLAVVLAAEETEVTLHADVVLAAASHVEDEGSFTNVDGITQRVRRAYPPKGSALPAWKWVSELATAMGHALELESSRDAFMKLAPAVPELKDFAWDAAAPRNQAKPGISTQAAASDGRPPGWREQGIPNLRGLSIVPSPVRS